MPQNLVRPQNAKADKKNRRNQNPSDNPRGNTYIVKEWKPSPRKEIPKKTQRNDTRVKGPLILKGDPNKHVQCIHEEYIVDGALMDVENAPIQLRMAIKVNQVDYLKGTIERPKGALPPVSLPTWDQLPLDSKLPDFRNKSWPPGSLFFTRGKVGEPLYRKNADYDLTDPKGLKNPADLGGYTALHDEHALNYFKSKVVQPILEKNELVNSKGYVLCGAKGFNQFRNYLSTLHNAGVTNRVKKEDSKKLFEATLRQPFLQFKYSQKFPNDYNAKFLKVREMQSNRINADTERTERNIIKWEKRLNKFKNEKLEQRYQTIRNQPREQYVSRYRRERKNADDFEDRKRLLAKSVFDIKRVAYNQNYDKLLSNILKERLEIDRIITLKKRDEQIFDLKEIIDETRKRNRERWISKYETHMKYSEIHHDKLVAAKIAKEQRTAWLEKKYFNMWRSYVKRLVAARPNSDHRTTFKVEKDFKDMVEYLYEESGYDPRENFFTRLLHNRNNLGQFIEGEKRKGSERNKKWRRTIVAQGDNSDGHDENYDSDDNRRKKGGRGKHKKKNNGRT